MSFNASSPPSLSPLSTLSTLISSVTASSSRAKTSTDPSSDASVASVPSSPSSPESLTTLKSLIHDSMTRFATLTEKYLDALSSNFNEPSTPPNPEEQNKNQKLLSELVDVDRQLAAHISKMNDLHALCIQRHSIDSAIQTLQSDTDTTVEFLIQAEEEIENALTELDAQFPAKLYSKPPLNLDTVLNYAQLLGATTHAPPFYDIPARQLKSVYKPPAPQEDMMRASLLFKQQSILLSDDSPSSTAAHLNVNTTHPSDKAVEKKRSSAPTSQTTSNLAHSIAHTQLIESDWLDLDLNPDLA